MDDPRLIREVLVAFAAVCVAVTLRSLADPWLGDTYPFELFIAAVAVAAWYGRAKAAFVAATLGYLLANYFFISPRNDFGPLSGPLAVSLLFYAAAACVVAAAGAFRRDGRAPAGLREVIDRALEQSDAVAWEWDVRSRIIRFSRNGFRLLGLPGEVRNPVQLLRHLPAAERESFIDTVREAIEAGRGFTVRFRFVRPTDQRIVSLVNHGAVVRSGDDAPPVVSGILTDETALHEAQKALRRVSEQFRKSHDASLRGYCIFRAIRTADGRITDFRWDYINPAGARIAKKRVSDLLGRTMLATFPDIPARGELIARMIEVCETGSPQDLEIFYEGRDAKGWFQNMIIPVGDGVAVEFHDVTQRKELEAELRTKATALSAADRQKNDFLALLGHELRNPLAPILTCLEVLKARTQKDEDAQPLLRVMSRQLDHIVKLIDDLLDIARIDQGKIKLNVQRTRLADVLDAAVESSLPNIAARRQRLLQEIEQTPMYVDVDPVRMSQVITNLLNNASKFSASGKRIWLAARRASDRVEIAVRDEGIGIERDQQEKIFLRFVQLESSAPHAAPGLGLGLSLVKNLTELHGGSVTVASEGRDRGSTFVVRLPLALDGPVAQSPASDAPSQRSDAPRRILIVDDNVDALSSLAAALILHGQVVTTAIDAESAIEIAARTHPDVVVLDLGMPGVDGYEAARRIRSEPWGCNVRLVALTAWGQDEDKRASADAGFDFHLTKPVSVEALLRALG